ncbi:MAG: aminomethyl-transferring glycine dehydrogenase subunit GcvPB [Dongiaceae bacterium]
MMRDIGSFHAARWAEPLVTDLGSPGERGVLPPGDAGLEAAIPDPLAALPAAMRRQRPPALPEISQARVLRHYVRLSQMCMGVDATPDMMGTCTMKYSPKVNDAVARLPAVAELHPLQDPSTMQGTLELLWRFGRMMAEIAGMDEVTFQAGSGAQGIYTNACIIRAYHAARGEGDRRDEIITTAFSHPIDAAAPAVAGYRVLTLMPGPQGYPELGALEAALSERTAGLMLANPEDTGLFNPAIRAMVDRVHQAGGLCAYDQANGNGVLGILRAGDAGFDLCQFNLHKTFSAPHASIGQGCAAVGVKAPLARFLPRPVVVRDGDIFRLDADRPDAIDKIRGFLGNLQTVLKAYLWTMSLGAEGLRTVAETAVLNSNYVMAGLRRLRGVDIPWPGNNSHRLEQVRYSLERLHAETGVSSSEVKWRMIDYGMQHTMESHVPMLVPQPLTIEPGESYTLDELDECLALMARIVEEAYSEPETVRTAPHRGPVPRLDMAAADEPARWAFTERAWRRKQGPPRG